jgi:1,2-dihydroxy-3-keto-5-methylthiopentene dioxygenase
VSRLRIFDETHPAAPRFASEERAAMAAELSEIGVRFEQWAASQPVGPGATSERVMAAYRTDIDRLVAEKASRPWTWSAPPTVRSAR